VENQDESPWESWAPRTATADESIITACEDNGRTGFAGECMSNATYADRLAAVTRIFSGNPCCSL
jgi:hypothetical protein